MASLLELNNRMLYEYRKNIRYIDNGITHIPNNNIKYCMNYLLYNNKNKQMPNFCKCQNNFGGFCSDICKNYFKNNRCQSFIFAVKKNEPIPNTCRIYKNNPN